jgi:hypothetical protein
LPFTEAIKSLRATIWDFVFEHYDNFPEVSDKLLTRYCDNIGFRKDQDFAAFDAVFIQNLMWEKLNPDNVLHCLLVNQYCHVISRFVELKLPELAKLKASFRCQKFDWLMILDRNRWRQRYRYEYDTLERDYKKFEIIKDEEIKTYFSFSSLSEFEAFYVVYLELNNLNERIKLEKSLDVILVKYWEENRGLCLSFLNCIIQKTPKLNFLPYDVFQVATENDVQMTALYQLITKNQFAGRDQWLLRFYDVLPAHFINPTYSADFLHFIHYLSTPSVFYDAKTLSKFQMHIPTVFRVWLENVVAKIEQGINIFIRNKFFPQNLHHFTDEDFPLVKKAYFQQYRLDNHFDYDHSCFFAILERNEVLLEEFIRFKHEDTHFRQSNGRTKLGIIWNFKNAEGLVERGIVLLRSLVFPIMSPFEFFFLDIPSTETERAKQFLLDFITKHHKNMDLVEVIVNITQSSFNDFYENVFKHFLTLNTDLGDFKKVGWEERANSSITGRGIILGEIHAHKLETQVRWIDSLPNPTQYIRHKAYLKKRIVEEKEHAQRERRRNFERDDFQIMRPPTLF